MLGKLWDPATARILCTIVLCAAMLALLYGARDTLTLFLFAILFAYFIEPLVGRLELRLQGRIKAIVVVYLSLIAILTCLGFAIGPRILEEGRSLAISLPSLFDRISSGQLVTQVSGKHGWSQDHQAQIQRFFLAHRSEILGYAGAVGAKLAEPVKHLWWLILIPILSLFFLKDGKMFAREIVDLGSDAGDRSTLRGIIGDVNVMLGSYIRAQLILASLTVVSYTVFLSFMRVPYAFILGPMAGICEFIPVVGPAVAAVTICAIAVLTSYPHLIWLIIFLGIWRVVQDYVNGPKIMGESLEISPVVQIFGVLAGGEIAGVVGALISVPVLATLRILWRRMSRGVRRTDAPLVPQPPINGRAVHVVSNVKSFSNEENE
ncbi:Putative permease often clustered with de novo purine synthesis (plasmid) [Acidisarcina polymorpha]|uniref:Permease often clustered with de novo purine synthesis n=1 Tax=Acidisarcina polymorpha TaxID=2211140 RepID=A0A2Z5GB50_9BACT|nr:AI-2E family transporter [Acidisarcina polymorpha]AXC16331.1 hypothetical protein ACPOL_7139 [Acidisarcina polymorpha]AXC16341.1 Putative permease often clustered with de novo purine synthesis [Acidisarcina polymorpha]